MLTDEEISEFVLKQKPKNTLTKTKSDVGIVTRWLSETLPAVNRDLENIPPAQLNSFLSSTCKIFADDAKIYTTVTSRQDQEDLQKDLDNLCQWSSDWLLKFNIQKCKVVSFGNVSSQYNYVMNEDTGGASALSSEDSEKDLGILFTHKLNFEKHINSTVNKVNKIFGLLRRKFTYMDKSLFLILYKALIRSHLNYGNLIYYPTTKKCKQLVENVQRGATRLVPELKGLSYAERIKALNLPSLEYRRKRFVMIQVYRLIHKKDHENMSTFFNFAGNSGTRGHSLKLHKPKAQNLYGSTLLATGL